MKQYLIFFMCLLFAVNISAQSLQGEGTAASPYLVKTADDLNSLRNYVGDAYKGKHFRMTNNIDVADWIANNADNDIKTNGWKPIGSNVAGEQFYGRFHGGGYLVTGIWMNRTAAYSGLFAYVNFGAIDSLGIKVPVLKEIKSTATHTGGIAGYQYNGSITNCYFSGTISSTSSYVGGIVGQSYSDTISFCYSEGEIKGGMYTGGIAGYISGVVEDGIVLSNCLSATTITASGTYTGGIVGYAQLNSETRKNVSVNVAITGANRIGGKTGTAVFEDNHAFESIPVNGAVRTSDNAALPNGKDQSLATLQMSTFYTGLGWTFGSLWTIRTGQGFPYFATVARSPAIATSRISTVTTEITGTYVPETGSKVWVKIGSGEVAEATVNTDGTWSAAISGQKATETAYVWTTAESRAESLPVSMMVEFANEGTPEDPFQVFSAADLQTMNIFRDKSYRLMQDIDLAEWIDEYGAGPDDFGWKPVGSSDATTFRGIFDGNGKTVTGLWCDWRWVKTGLFGTVAGATVKNLTVRVAEGKILTGGSGRETGIIAGIFNGSMSNCSAYGAVQSPQEGTGGIVGILTGGEIKNSFAYVENLFNGNGQGGFVGKILNDGKITNCYVAGILSGHQFVGGIVGYMQTGSATLSGNVSALASIKGTTGTPFRIADNNWGENVLQDNLAWVGMTVNGSVITSDDASSTHGKDASMDELYRQETYEAIGWTFDNSHWAIWEGYSLPYFPRQTAPAVLNGTPVAGIAILSGSYRQGDAEKVWVRINDLPAEEASMNSGEWTLTVDALPAGTKISLWATSASKAMSNANSYYVGYAQGAGTVDDPYPIRTGDEMNAVRYFLSAHYRLENDIDLTAWTDNHASNDIRAGGWLPVGAETNPFTGTFDGKGHAIKMSINRPPAGGLGLFGNIEGGTVKNLNMEVDITGTNSLGGIAGSMGSGLVDSCRITGTITLYNNTAGGIVGNISNSTVHASSFSGTITGSGVYNKDYIGGITGSASANSVISFCYATADLTGSNNVGGIVGYASGAEISNCSSSGYMHGAASVGGIAGQAQYGTNKINNCIASGPVSGLSNIGGIAGLAGNAATIENNVAAMVELNAGTNVSRIANGTLSRSNNLALATMLVQRQTRTSSDDTDANGKDATADELYAQTTYSAAGNWHFGADGRTVWEGNSTPYFPEQAAPATLVTPVYVTDGSIGGTLNPAETGKVWVRINNSEAMEATVTNNTWSLTVSGFYPDDVIGIWTTKEGLKRSNDVWAFAKTEALEGSGVEDDPYLIRDGNSLYAIRYIAPGAYYRVVNDIDLTGFLSKNSAGTGWLPVGESSAPFEGTIHGGGHTISEYWSTTQGLFAYVRNTGIDSLNVQVKEGAAMGVGDVGALVGSAGQSCLFDNCHVSGNFTLSGTANGALIGSFIGSGAITNSSFIGAMRSTGNYGGGIVGNPGNITIRNCYVVGDTIAGRMYAGGIAGLMGGYNMIIQDCYTSITVKAAMYDAGGIAGYVMKSGNGTVTTISNCYSAGNIIGGSTAGGIVGTNQSIVTNCVAVGNIYTASTAGRIVSNNTNGGSVTNNYAFDGIKIPEGHMAPGDDVNGEPLARTELLTRAPYEDLGWDFTDTWAICESGAGFPYLQWQSALCLPNDTLKMTYGGGSATVHPSAVHVPDGVTPEYRYKLVSSGKYASVNDNGTVSPLAAGIDTLRVTLVNSGYSVDCIIDVSTIAITVIADNLTKMYGEADPSLTWKITKGNLLEGDHLNGALTRSDGGPWVTENAGTHDILRGTLGNPNYNITFVKGVLTITSRPVTLTADNKEKVYGETDPVFTYQKTDGSFGFEDILDDIVYGTLERESGENGGTYAIRQGSLTFISNYDVTFMEGVFTIQRANQTVTLEAMERKCADSDDEIVLKGAATSGLLLRFESSNPKVAIVTADDGWVHINGAGTTRFIAYQDGNENFNPATSNERTFIVDLPSSTVKNKWNNEVLVVDNKDGKFAAYQWYRNGKMIDGASEQACTINGFVADYMVTIITVDGETLKTCPYKPTLTIAKASEGKAWPNPVRTSQRLTVELPLTDEEANGATIRVYDSNGKLVSTSKTEQSRWLMNSPASAGLYHIRVVTTKGDTVNVKIVVE
jgi:hypothetical protein